jgi:hypothetical protein
MRPDRQAGLHKTPAMISVRPTATHKKFARFLVAPKTSRRQTFKNTVFIQCLDMKTPIWHTACKVISAQINDDQHNERALGARAKQRHCSSD